ncbi:MAG: sigma-54-dependent Fis family transcriptional regulator [Deltaproteobacteria bacterium]|nr:sigma-54-dependent Fis family transcriptional regulator [Deltaproteobacteria bacterium]
MGTQETTHIAVCAAGQTELEEVVAVVRQSGAWSVLPILWPDAAGLIEARTLAQAYLLFSGRSASGAYAECAELSELLRSRPPGAPLIVVGADASAPATPNMWTPVMPPPQLLGSMLTHLLDGRPAKDVPDKAPAWRRKSDMIIGDSLPIRRLLHSLDQLAPATTPVLITGESGVGKELVARSLHFCGPRAPQPFIAINCAAIPDNLIEAELFGYQRGAFTGAVNAHAGAFEAAHQGTLFLDEIGDMPLGMQAKLLRVLESSEVQRIGSTDRIEVDFRLVSATNRNLEAEVKAGRFREDLYYRVLVYPVHVPPLRERAEDIPRLVTHHLSAIAARENRMAPRLTPAALEQLLGHGWPGNIRELVNTLERASLLAEDRTIDAPDIILSNGPGDHAPAVLAPYREAKAKFETDYYTQLMRTAGGNVSLASKLGQKTRKEIYDALKRCDIDLSQFTGPASRR